MKIINMKTIKNKTALVTGASTGIGKELALIHAEKGGDLVVVARNREKLEDLKSQLEKNYAVNVRVIVKDLGKPEAPKEIYDEISKAGIQVDYLINNAGFGGIGKFHERDWQQDLAMINLNIIALTALTRFFLPDFVDRNEGRILNVSSTASLMPGPLQAVYYASKAFVTSFSNAVAEELHDTKITVTALLPGATESEFGRISGMDKTKLFQKTASARKVAEDGYNGMLKGKLNVITGIPAALRIMLPIIPLTPKKIVLQQVRQMQQV
jgi:short-subunit dehydrogenase